MKYYIALLLNWLFFKDPLFEKIVQDLRDEKFELKNGVLTHSKNDYSIRGFRFNSFNLRIHDTSGANDGGTIEETMPRLYQIIIFHLAQKLYNKKFLEKIQSTAK